MLFRTRLMWNTRYIEVKMMIPNSFDRHLVPTWLFRNPTISTLFSCHVGPQNSRVWLECTTLIWSKVCVSYIRMKFMLEFLANIWKTLSVIPFQMQMYYFSTGTIFFAATSNDMTLCSGAHANPIHWSADSERLRIPSWTGKTLFIASYAN